MPDAQQKAEQVYLTLTQEDCPHPWDGQPHLKSACRRCTIEGYADALHATEQRVWEEAANMMKAVQGCNCAAVDIGVGTLHEPTCGLTSPEEAEKEFRHRAQEGK